MMAASAGHQFTLLPCTVTDVVRSTASGPAVAFQDIHFTTPPAGLTSIQFQNYYAAAVAFSQETTDAPGSFVRLTDRYTLMADAHFEGDAREWHQITIEDVRCEPSVRTCSPFVTFGPSCASVV